MGEVQAVWNEQRLIESFDVDMFGRLRPHTLFSLLLNCAWNHAKGTVYGYQELSIRNLTWVMLKLHLRIDRWPTWRDRILLETWGKRAEKFYGLRDFAVSTLSGERMASASAVMMILDKTSGRPQRLDPKTDGFPWTPQKEDFVTNLEKVPQQTEGKETARYFVRFSDLDANRHVTATKYLQWMIDSRSQEELETKVPKVIEISFLAEAIAKDEVAVYSEEKVEDLELLSIRRINDSKELCRGRIEWTIS